ncbi:DNA repair-scaffolding protein isoform X2 [Pseudoliparis swirei]|uniref:DNA repair-scaffolding protein isoform X2 n=1 Tax=Pseudoliparis swirei TaxID=2059687 RepID=UPI0024BD8CC9|nr:DNA repair-scaffolding protein isoform X2 [Pseudoliparis swirei]
MFPRKRRRCHKDVKCAFFPEDVGDGLKGAGRLSSVSCARSWETCGDSFLDSPAMKNVKTSGRKLSDLRKSPAIVQTGAVHEDPVHIAWSSSDGERSDDETQEQQPPPPRPRRPAAPIESYTRALRMLRTETEDLPVIDTDSDLDESEEDVEKDSGQQISDCESSDEKQEDLPLQPTDSTELEISGYASSGENADVAVTSSRPGSPLRSGEGSKRSVSDWVRSAQAMLQTPQKPPSTRPSKTPEDSAKKKRKFQSGGLAERLNRLQCRQRSAVGFWRHQSISDTTTTTTTTVDRPGVLVLEVLEVQEECSVQLALCELHRPPGEARQHGTPPPSERSAHVLVLFNRETAAQLIPAPRDVVHVYPPWQSLSIEGFSRDVILNTHFSQKVYSATKAAGVCVPGGDARRPYPLGETFGPLEETAAKQAAASGAPCRFGGAAASARRCLSLLEAIEGLGRAGSVGQDVEVVVQRVYSVPAADCSPASALKPRLPAGSSSDPLAEKGKTRLCALVQDGYGMFSVVQLHFLPRDDDLHEYCRRWQGRSCLLRGVTVLRRVTRERSARLFSLIDSLWPPVTPLRDHGNTASVCTESRPAGAAPSFCYLLSGQESSVEPAEEREASPLYAPPARHTLREVLQGEHKTRRCSFVATVLYKRKMQSRDVGQGEVWLVLTDPSLQEEQRPERPRRRTVALCVSTSCALTSSVLESLDSPAACRMSFRDVIVERGVLLCVEQSVVGMCSADPDGPEPRAETPPRPVRLDPLSSEVTPNSVCSLSGVIVGVDEAAAFSWPACNRCGSDDLETSPDPRRKLRCVSCKSSVDKPDTRIQLEVFLSSSLSNCTLKVKLQPKTITSVLNTAALEGHEVTMWRMSWEKKWAPSPFTSESSPGNRPSGLAWKKSASLSLSGYVILWTRG